MIVTTSNGAVIDTVGDPDHPINEGALCSKGNALYQVANNPRRLQTVQYRAPGSDRWEEKSWEWAIAKIARNIKQTRDRTFKEREGNNIVNRTEGIAVLGGAALDSEECYLLSRFSRSLGVVYLEHQARICHSSTVASLAESFGRGAMTNHWIDIGNSDCILIIGSNAAENHPVSFKWVARAREKGAKLINVDPRFTRTSAKADLYSQMRPGTDIAFIGGMIGYCLQNDLYHKEYVVEYTNASFLIDPGFQFNDGLFSGYDPANRRYDASTWAYRLDGGGNPRKDKTLKDPNCVFQLLKKHFSRYTIDRVCAITGADRANYLEIARTFCATGQPGKSGTIMYAMGTTQHTHGTQNIRGYAILQLLLGNIGVAGGGINAMRGESNVQGSTDHCLLFHILPGYLKIPNAGQQTYQAYLDAATPSTNDPMSANWWGNYPRYCTSLLKAWYGENANEDNEFAYGYLPKISGNYSHIALFEAMHEGTIRGALLFGQNPAVGGPNAEKERKALDNLDWMVAVDLWETDTAVHWKRPGVNPGKIKTEVFLLPACSSIEKEGSIVNSGRWSQWRRAAVRPLGQSKPDLAIIDMLCKAVKHEYARGGKFPAPIRDLQWNYTVTKHHEIDPHAVAKEINGYFLEDVTVKGKKFKAGTLVPGFAYLMDDGSTSSGNWLYCGSYTGEGNMAARRSRGPGAFNIGLYPGWAWCWPMNRRIIYNRASVDLNGVPWDKEHPVIAWDAAAKKWRGDVPDGGWPPGAKHPFIMKPEGHARLFGPGRADGPFPEHYEPLESPVRNLLSSQQHNPVIKIWEPDKIGASTQYPIVGTTYRVSEHWLAGSMTRNLPWLVELVPDVFVEMSEMLAKQQGIKNGDRVEISTKRGKMKAYAVVTQRVKPYKIGEKTVHLIGVIWHFGYNGLATGGSANVLTAHVGDANTMIPEYKAFLCNIKKA
jgi:formate dehydrogenase major subunit